MILFCIDFVIASQMYPLRASHYTFLLYHIRTIATTSDYIAILYWSKVYLFKRSSNVVQRTMMSRKCDLTIWNRISLIVTNGSTHTHSPIRRVIIKSWHTTMAYSTINIIHVLLIHTKSHHSEKKVHRTNWNSRPGQRNVVSYRHRMNFLLHQSTMEIRFQRRNRMT